MAKDKKIAVKSAARAVARKGKSKKSAQVIALRPSAAMLAALDAVAAMKPTGKPKRTRH